MKRTSRAGDFNSEQPMRYFVIVVLIVSNLFLINGNSYCCGDKFLVVGRGIRYERAYAAKFPASILIYANNTDAVKNLQSMLNKSGHKVKNVDDETKLFLTLQSNKYDLVLLGISDVALLEKKLISTPSKPTVLPVIYNFTGAELEAAKSQYSCVLKSTNKNKKAISVIDEVMDARKKGKPIVCNWTN
jgi:hypothetical protein